MTSKRSGLAWLVFLVYLAVLLKVVLFKYPHAVQLLFGAVDRSPLGTRVQYSNFIPFKTIAGYLNGNHGPRIALENLAGNILLFVPMGFLLPAVLPRLHRLRLVAAVAFAFSLALEALQLLTGIGQLNVDDLLLNLLGATIGWWIHTGWQSVMARRGP